MKKRVLISALLVLAALAAVSFVSWPCHAPDASKLRDGDIVFHESTSVVAPVIRLGQRSRWTHCGIIFFEDGRPYVYEALDPVRKTPLDRWLARGGGNSKVMRLKEPLSDKEMKAVKREARAMLGRHYDTVFAWDDGRIYCSELVWKAYDRGAGIRLCEPTSVRKMGLDNRLVRFLAAKKIGKDRVDGISGDEPLVTPAQIAKSGKLRKVR